MTTRPTRTPTNSPPVWFKDYMDDLNEVIFDMREDGGDPENLAYFLMARACVELALAGSSRGESEALLSDMVKWAVSGVYRGAAANNEMVGGSA